jgi:hypothetical protein
MILPREEGEAQDREGEQGKVQEEDKGVAGDPGADIVGKQSVATRKVSATVGAEVELLAAQEEQAKPKPGEETKVTSPSANETKAKAKAKVKAEVMAKEEAGTSGGQEKLSAQLESQNVRHAQSELKPTAISDLPVINQDPYLKPHEQELQARVKSFHGWLAKFEEHEGGILGFSQSYQRMGLNRVAGGIQYREWAPGARKLSLCGEFNGWNRSSHECKRNEFGVWELLVPDGPDGTPAIAHNSRVKASLVLSNGQIVLVELHS